MLVPEADPVLWEIAAVVALMKAGRGPTARQADLIEQEGSAVAVLEQEHGLLAADLTKAAAEEVVRWLEEGFRPMTVLDSDYPQVLRAVYDRPALIFVTGELRPADQHAVAVIGSRRASPRGLERAREIAEELVAANYTVVSGLAAGIDTAVHTRALSSGGRTIAVIGTGLGRCYPPENAALQRRIASDVAVISQFWPQEGPRPENFRRRNALMSGLTLATVIVEAGQTSGTRIQARQALAHGRPVLLSDALLDQSWAQQLAGRGGVHVFESAADITTTVGRLASLEMPGA